jgi:single-stranded DNA-binding protein
MVVGRKLRCRSSSYGGLRVVRMRCFSSWEEQKSGRRLTTGMQRHSVAATIERIGIGKSSNSNSNVQRQSLTVTVNQSINQSINTVKDPQSSGGARRLCLPRYLSSSSSSSSMTLVHQPAAIACILFGFLFDAATTTGPAAGKGKTSPPRSQRIACCPSLKNSDDLHCLQRFWCFFCH